MYFNIKDTEKQKTFKNELKKKIFIWNLIFRKLKKKIKIKNLWNEF